MDETFVMLKPDCVRRKIMGEIISRIEKKGLGIVEMQLISPSREIIETHYAEHAGKPFFTELVNYVTSGPVVTMRVIGENAVTNMRNLSGATNPLEALPGTIRGDFGLVINENLIHASDSSESAKRELSIFFGD